MAAIQALIFDLDGTLIQSMPLHERSWAVLFEELQWPFDREAFFERTTGKTNAEIFAALMPHASVSEHERLALRKESLYRQLARTELQAVPGALAFMQAARDAGLKLAIGTAAPLGNIEVAFAAFPFGSLVATVASPADGLRGKPAPDLFAEPARRLNVLPAHCLVFEDAPLGVEAAQRAGMKAVGLTTTVHAGAFATYPNCVRCVPDFLNLELPALLAQAAAHESHPHA
jgi:beta-phosphoglucomutase